MRNRPGRNGPGGGRRQSRGVSRPPRRSRLFQAPPDSTGFGGACASKGRITRLRRSVVIGGPALVAVATMGAKGCSTTSTSSGTTAATAKTATAVGHHRRLPDHRVRIAHHVQLSGTQQPAGRSSADDPRSATSTWRTAPPACPTSKRKPATRPASAPPCPRLVEPRIQRERVAHPTLERRHRAGRARLLGQLARQETSQQASASSW
jgi:hypothetical protein